MTDFVADDTVYFTVWSDRNCGPPLSTEYSGTVVDNNYEPTDADRVACGADYFELGLRYVVVDLHSGWRPNVVVAATELRTAPSPRPVHRNSGID